MQLILITGLSGSGKSVALNVLEDSGFYCVDNLPPQLVPALIEHLDASGHRRVALSIDARGGVALAEVPRQVAALCSQAHALAFASFYEGFGRPTLEAQACGLPCVLADASCMREVGGDGALYHEPLSHEACAGQLREALTNETARGDLIQKGLENVKRFSWSGYAEKLVRVYREVAT